MIVSDASGRGTTPTSLISDAHAAGLLVHAYTFRNEPGFLLTDYSGDPQLEYQQYFNLGLDGLFTDFPGTGFEQASLLFPLSPVAPLLGQGLLA
jgi:glycerophosphoryl diester phosphodiesterase